MQKLYAFAGLLLLCLIPNFLSAQNEWAQFPDFPGTARDQAVGLAVGEFGLVGLGYDGTNDLNDFWKFDPGTESWTQIAAFPGEARRQATAFAINGKAYVGLGRSGSGSSQVLYKDFYEYDPATDTWTQIADFTGSARYKALSFTLDGKGHVTLGRNETGYPTDVYAYDPSGNSWSTKADFGGSGREGAFVFNLNGEVYIGSGYQYDGGSFAQNDYYQYDASADSWTEIGLLPGTVTLTDNILYFSLNGKGYFGKGYDDKLYAFDPTDNSFTSTVTFRPVNEGRYKLGKAAAFSIGARAYAVTGSLSEEYTQGTFAFAEDFVVPYGPGNVKIKMLTTSELEISWTDRADNEEGYKVYLSLTGTSNYQLYATLPANSTSFIDKDITVPQYRYYKINSFADVERSGTKVDIYTFDPFSAPSKLFATTSSSNHIELSWKDNSTYEKGYIVERKIGDGGTFEAIDTVATDITSYVDEQVTTATLHAYRVKAIFETAEPSAYSNPAYEWATDKGRWIKLKAYNLPYTSNLASFELNGKQYIGTGYTPGYNYTQDFYVYDPTTQEFSSIAPFPGKARARAVAFTINGKGYVGLGYDGTNSLNDMYAYDPATNSWSQIASYPGINTMDAAGFGIENAGYVVGGDNYRYDYAGSGEVWQYLPASDSWTSLAKFPGHDREGAVFTEYNGIAYGGFGSSSTTEAQTFDFFSYNPATASWAAVANPNLGEGNIMWSNALATVHNEKIYIGGGRFVRDGSYASSKGFFMEYTPVTNSWKSIAYFPIDYTGYTSPYEQKFGFALATNTGLQAGFYNSTTKQFEVYQYQENIPNKPTSLKIERIADDQLTFSWTDNSSNETGFIISNPYGMQDTIAANVSSYTYTWADWYNYGGQTTDFSIKAFNSYGNSHTSKTSFYMPLIPPTDLSLTATSNKVTAQWEHPATNYTRFLLTVSTKEDFADTLYNRWSQVYGNLLSFEELEENTRYYVRVKTINNTASTEAIQASTLTELHPTRELKGYANNLRVSLSWQDSSKYETGYIIERKEESAEVYQLLDSLPANTTTYLDTVDIQELTSYVYRVKAFSPDNESIYTHSKSVHSHLLAPKELTFEKVEANNLHLRWVDNSIYTERAIIEREEVNTGQRWTYSVEEDSSVFIDTGLKENTRYRYQVTTIAGLSGSSKTAAVDTLTRLNKPTLAQISNDSLSWVNNSAYATQIIIETTSDLTTGFSPFDTLSVAENSYPKADLIAELPAYARLKAISPTNASNYSDTAFISPTRTITADSVTTDKVYLSLDAPVHGNFYYTVERTLAGSSEFVVIDTLQSGKADYIDVTAAEGTKYEYQLVTLSTLGHRQQSARTSAHTLLYSPTSLLAEEITDRSATLSWTDNSDKESEYVIEQLNPANETFYIIGRTAADENQFVVTSLSRDTQYTFRVQAANADVKSPYSAELTINTLLTGIEEESIQAGYRIYPNPTRGTFTLKASQAYERIEILDASGKQVQAYAPTENDQYAVDSLKPGLYLLRIIEKDKVYLQRFIKQ